MPWLQADTVAGEVELLAAGFERHPVLLVDQNLLAFVELLLTPFVQLLRLPSSVLP